MVDEPTSTIKNKHIPDVFDCLTQIRPQKPKIKTPYSLQMYAQGIKVANSESLN